MDSGARVTCQGRLVGTAERCAAGGGSPVEMRSRNQAEGELLRALNSVQWLLAVTCSNASITCL